MCLHQPVVTHLKINESNCFCPSSKLTIYAQPSQIHTAEYAADVTKIIFDYFEEYFNMTYSISKLGRFHTISSQSFFATAKVSTACCFHPRQDRHP